MPMKLILNTTNAAEAGRDPTRLWVVQTGLIQDYDCTIPSDTLVTLLANQGMPQPRQPLSVNRPDLLARQFLIRALNSRQAVARIVYTTPLGKSPVETFSVEDSTSLASGTTQILPHSGKPLRLTYEAAGQVLYEDTQTVSFPMPMRNLVISGLFSDRPSSNIQTNIRRVNDNSWQGFPKGYWLYSGVDVRYSDIDEMYRVTCSFTSKCAEDWSSYVILKRPDGRYVKVDEAVMTGLYSQDYAWGIRNQNKGVLKVGLFKEAAFNSIFGV